MYAQKVEVKDLKENIFKTLSSKEVVDQIKTQLIFLLSVAGLLFTIHFPTCQIKLHPVFAQICQIFN